MNTLEAIKNIEIGDEDKKSEQDIKEYLRLSASMALALNENIYKKLEDKVRDEIDFKDIEKIINSNMFRHYYIAQSLINYTNSYKKNVNYFEDYFLDKKFKISKIELDKLKIRFSPRFIHYEELQIFYINKLILESKMINEHKKYLEYINQSQKKFESRNVEELVEQINLEEITEDRNEIKIKRRFFEIHNENDIKLEKMKIAVANINIPENYIEKNLEGNQILTKERYQKLTKILNIAKENRVNMLVFPEVSIPIQWLSELSKFSRKNDIAIVCGLEHVFNHNAPFEPKKYANNFITTILPFSLGKYKSTFIKIRLKNDYSPGEIKMIEGRHLGVPVLDEKEYDLFKWKGVYFTCFNCFELTDMVERSKFRGDIDLLVASVYNRDINYFSNILQSSCRDLHSYVVQVNTSDYGDSGILRPSNTETMKVINIKGGENVGVLVGEINIDELREFQMKNYQVQEDNKKFKFTPPGIKPDRVKKRMDGVLFHEKKNKTNK